MNESHLTLVEDGEDYGDKQIVPIDRDEKFGILRKEIVDARKNMDASRWELAKRLHEVKEKGLFIQFGYPTWEKYIQTEVGYSVRSADILRDIYSFFGGVLTEKIEDSEEQESMISQIRELGWTKARHLTGVCNEDNYQDWIDLANKLTVADLETEVKRSLVRDNGGDSDSVSDMKTKSYKFSEGQLDMVEQAVELAAQASGSKKKSHNLSLVCQQYVADNMASGSNEDIRNKMLLRTAAQFSVDIIALDPASKKVVLGKELLKLAVMQDEELLKEIRDKK